jgi:hypothetical protein
MMLSFVSWVSHNLRVGFFRTNPKGDNAMALKAKSMRDVAPVFWDVAVRDHGKCVYCRLDGSRDIRILSTLTLEPPDTKMREWN